MNTDILWFKAKDDKGIYIQKLELKSSVCATKEEFMEQVRRYIDGELLDIADAHTSHFCGCGEISYSPDENVLCEKCKTTCGHAYEGDL